MKKKKMFSVGHRVNRLSYIEEDIDMSTKRKRRFVKLLCDCGNTKSIYCYHWTSGKTKSCGCLGKEACSLMARNRSTNKLRDKDRDEMVIMWKDGLSTGEIADKFKVTSSSVLSALRTRGYDTDGRVRDNGMISNHNAFDTQTEEADYWGGYIACDGYISRKGQISLTSKDYEHIVKFKSFVGSKNKILVDGRNGSTSFTLSITSKKILDVLLKKYGLHNNKTYTYSVPILVSNNTAFWRGCVDADGWFSKQEIGLAGTLDKCEKFMSFVQSEIGIKMRLKKKKLTHINGYSYAAISTRQSDILRILNMLYDNARIFLSRKYEKYITITKHKGEHYDI